MEWAVSIGIGVVPTALVVIALIYLVSRGLPQRQESVSAVKAYAAYSYALIGLGVVAGIVGLILFVRIGMMAAFDVDWTENDITVASVITGIGLIIAGLHTGTKAAVKRRAEEALTAAKRLYLAWLTFSLGIATLVSVPLAVYRIVRYYREVIAPPPPATELAIAIVVLVIWVYYLLRLLRETEKGD
jgi:hypothetical protein